MKKPGAASWIGQVTAYAVFGLLIGILSAWPTSARIAAGQALIKLSFTHAGARLEECRKLDPAEIAKLAPNMRVELDCSRGRVPVVVELKIDGAVWYRGSHEPTGLWGDGPSVVYEKFRVPAREHHVEVRIRDSRRETGFDYVASRTVELVEHQNLVIDFRPGEQGVIFH